MYSRVIYESWADWVPYIAFAIMAGVFLTFVVRAIRMRPEPAEKLARMPLDS